MRLDAFDKRDGYRVWLNDDETRRFIAKMRERGKRRNSTEHRIAARLGAHCGLRRDEAAQVRAVDVVSNLGHTNLRVWEEQAKQGKYRETPIPSELGNTIETMQEQNDHIDIDDPVLDVSPRTLNRWVKRACEELYSETSDEGWREVTYHDLRRTWGVRLLEQGVLPSVVMLHGGWEDWETFKQHYLEEFSPHALKREREKVSWLGGGSQAEVAEADPVVTTARSR